MSEKNKNDSNAKTAFEQRVKESKQKAIEENIKSAEKLLKDFGKVSLVTATNVFAHIPNPLNVLENISLVLEDGGIFISENHYFPDLINQCIYNRNKFNFELYNSKRRDANINFLLKFLVIYLDTPLS
jgi:SAM-dependent methyltransferase